MDITRIAQKLNQMAVESNFQIASLPELRKKYLGKKTLPNKIFTKHTIFNNDDIYAFHHGGRDEMQFNIGVELLEKDKSYTRVGLCFSLEPSPSLIDPVKILNKYKDRFNACIEEFPDLFKEFEMWYYHDGKRYGNFNPQKITDKWFKKYSFISVGKIIKKSLNELNDLDIIQILEIFDKLLPIYKFSVLNEVNICRVEKRISRIAWNENGWVMPSGFKGKSKHPDTHEAKFGYGHEEWLLDTGKIIDGFHYGFLEPVRQEQDSYTFNKYDVWLYSINGETKKRYWIGEIKDLIVIDKKESEKILEIYKQKKWLNEMGNQIKDVGANERGFSGWKGLDLFNVKFKPENIYVNEPYYELNNEHPVYKQSRYTFAHYHDEYDIAINEESDDFTFNPTNRDDEDDEKIKSKHYNREPKPVEIIYLHKAISKALAKVLKRKYGSKNVEREHPAGYGSNKIDIVVKIKEEVIFYEIKTYNSLRASIREALGQLMEYNFYPNKNKAKELIIVSQFPVDNKTIIYLEHLRNLFKLPIYYQHFDLKKCELSKMY